MKKTLISAIAGSFVLMASQAHATQSAAGVFSATETIINNGNGTYTYDYSLTNLSSTNAAWWFVVTTNATDATNATALNNSAWQVALQPNGFTNVSGWTNTIYSWAAADSWPSSVPDGIAQGQTFSGMSYTSSVYDPTPKEFLVDVAGYWNNPDFSYGGATVSSVPEADTLALMVAGLAMLGVAARRRSAA